MKTPTASTVLLVTTVVLSVCVGGGGTGTAGVVCLLYQRDVWAEDVQRESLLELPHPPSFLPTIHCTPLLKFHSCLFKNPICLGECKAEEMLLSLPPCLAASPSVSQSIYRFAKVIREWHGACGF